MNKEKEEGRMKNEETFGDDRNRFVSAFCILHSAFPA